jgi:hypothetical protein
VLHGCIPVVVMDNVHAVLEGALDWDAFSVGRWGWGRWGWGRRWGWGWGCRWGLLLWRLACEAGDAGSLAQAAADLLPLLLPLLQLRINEGSVEDLPRILKSIPQDRVRSGCSLVLATAACTLLECELV